MKKVNSQGYGDHYVHVKIAVPKLLSKKQKALMQAYAEIEEDTPGQIYGVAYDRDGKNESTSNSGDKKTSSNFENYSEPKMSNMNREKFNDKKSKEGFFNILSMAYEDNRPVFLFGFLMSISCGILWWFFNRPPDKPGKDNWNLGKQGAGLLTFPNGYDNTWVHGSILRKKDKDEDFKDT